MGSRPVEDFSTGVQAAVADWLRQVHPGSTLDRDQIEKVVERAIAGWMSSDAGRLFLTDAVRTGVEQTAQTWLCQNHDAVVRAIGEGRRPAAVSRDMQ